MQRAHGEAPILSAVQQWPIFALTVVACAALLGCSPSPSESHKLAISSEEAAKRAWEEKNPEAARKAFEKADRAEASLDKALKKAANDKDREVLQRQLAEVRLAARNARKSAETAEQEHERQDRLTGLKVKAYAKARGLVLETLVPRMAGAAAKAGENGLDQLSVTDRGFAELAWHCLNVTKPRPPPVKDREQWAAAANTVRTWQTNSPTEFRLVLACCFASIGMSDFALFELESIHSVPEADREWRLIHRVAKGVFYSLQGWNRLASSEFEAVAKEADGDGSIDGDALVALVHGVEAYDAMNKNELVRMDAEIAESMRAWPNNPLSVYLTGERLAANGEWEKAAESFQSAVAGTKDEWLAERLAARARALRDGKGTAKSLVLDAPLLIEFGVHMVSNKMANSPVQNRVQAAISQVRSAADELRKNIRLRGSAPLPATQATAVTNSPEAQ